MSVPAIRKNHYVPIWYQKSFLVGGKSSLYFLDLTRSRTLRDGKVIAGRPVNIRSPKSCFWSQDLYTTKFGHIYNDDIEKYFFGEIDNMGAKAVKAFANNDFGAIHSLFQRFFEYLDIQKLRTPKGLDWIRSNYPGLTQLTLMVEMQGLRQMHCTMWYECVREIVSAEESDVKFIVTDHPVTTYNAAYPPDATECRYPHDPPIELVGTQTIFALDFNTCLVLSNLEYANNPNTVDLRRQRTHARYRGYTIARTDAFIRKRRLTRDEVITINHLLKVRACKYIAASSEDWLYPERSYLGRWADISRTLLPPKDELLHFGGETIIGYEDGTSYYQDAFGRTTGPHKHLKKKQPSKPLSQNEQCGCGSGRQFRDCCYGRQIEDRPSWEYYSIRERNLLLINAAKEILGLSKGKSWDDVRKELNDDQVSRLHKVIESLWPRETDLVQLLPRPDERMFRAVFIGFVDPRTIALNVISWLLYFDEILIASPFLNPTFLKPEFSPVHSPTQHKWQLLKNVLLLFALEPFIKSGQIHMIPDPSDFNDIFRKSIWSMAEQRVGSPSISDNDMGLYKRLARDDFQRSTRGLPSDALRHLILRTSPDVKPEVVDRLVDIMREENSRDPLTLLQPMLPGKKGGQLLSIKGLNLELGLFLAHCTGSVIYTDVPLHWEHLHKDTSAGHDLHGPSQWTPLIERVRDTTFILDSDPRAVLMLRNSEASESIRRVFRKAAKLSANESRKVNRKLAKEVAAEFHQCFKAMRKKLRATDSSEAVRFTARVEISFPKSGFERNSIRRLLLTFGRTKNIAGVLIGLHVKLEIAHQTR